MPITEEDWDSATPAISDREFVQNFLEKNPERAYSSGDIAAERTGLSEDDGLGFTIMALYFESVLDSLADEGRVNLRMVDEIAEDNAINQAYYRAANNHQTD